MFTTTPTRPAHDAPEPSRADGPWYDAIDVVVGDREHLRVRAWLDDCLVRAGAPAHVRPQLRQVAVELTREAAAHAAPGDPLRVEVDLVGVVARVSVTGPTATHRLGSRAVGALRSAYEWGTSSLAGGRWAVWCHVDLRSHAA